MGKNLFILLFLLVLLNGCNSFSGKKRSASKQAVEETFPANTRQWYIEPGKSLPSYLLRESQQIENFETLRPILSAQASLNKSFKNEATGIYIYPEYYGGSYINGKGEWIIFVVGKDTANYRQDLKKRAVTNDFILRETEYSYNQLNEIVDSLNILLQRKDITDSLKKILGRNARLHPYIRENRVVIMLDKERFTSETIKALKRLLPDSSALIYERFNDIPRVQ